MAAAQRQKVDEPNVEARVRLPNVEGPMTKVGLPNAGLPWTRCPVNALQTLYRLFMRMSSAGRPDAVSAAFQDDTSTLIKKKDVWQIGWQ